MNKYEEALETIMKQIDILCEDGIFINFRHNNEYFILKELVDKATPKKPTVLSYSEDFRLEKIISCNSCKKPVVNVWSYRTYKPNYCHYCGQSLDWSTDE